MQKKDENAWDLVDEYENTRVSFQEVAIAIDSISVLIMGVSLPIDIRGR